MSRHVVEQERPLARLLVESVLGVVDRPLGDDVVAAGVRQASAAALDHRVTPALARRVRSAPDAPEGWWPALGAHRHAQLLRHMQASGDVRTVGEVLAAAGIEWVVAKGPVAADLIWPSPDMREYYDVDVFVARNDFATALAALQDSGFALVDRNWPELLRTMRAEIALRGPAGTHLDLHWDIAVPPKLRRAFRTDLPIMLGRNVEKRLGSGVPICTFDEVDTVLHLAFHAAQAGANRLLWIADIHHATAREGFDWDELEIRSRSARMEVPLAIVLERVERCLDFRVGPPASLVAPAQGIWGSIVRKREQRNPFPGLPGDESRSGTLFASARPSVLNSVEEAARMAWSVRRTEHRIAKHGPDDRVLYRDVPDESARRAYLARVAEAGA